MWLAPALSALSPVPSSSAAWPRPLSLLLSRLLCILALCFDASTSAFPCLCHCLFLLSLLLLAPVDIKVIKDLPWPPPVGQLDSSPSLPDGDRDISAPASPLPEPSLEDSSGGSFGDCGQGDRSFTSQPLWARVGGIPCPGGRRKRRSTFPTPTQSRMCGLLTKALSLGKLRQEDCHELHSSIKQPRL